MSARARMSIVAALGLIISTIRLPAQPAQPEPADGALRVRVGGDIDVAAADREQVVIVVRGDAYVRGSVDVLIVVEGTATLDGGRVHDLTVVRGTADLRSGAVVTGDAHLVESAIAVGEGSRVEGRIERGPGVRMARDFLAVVALAGVGMFLTLLLVGAVAARIAPRALDRTSAAMRGEPGRVTLAALGAWLLAPLVALLLIASVVGMPLGFGYLLLAMPLLLLGGLVTSGAWIGGALIRQLHRDERPVSPVSATALGIAILLLVARIPLLGLASVLLVLFGAGATALVAVRAASPALFNPSRTAS